MCSKLKRFTREELDYRFDKLIEGKIKFYESSNKYVIDGDIVRLPIINGLYCGFEVIKREKIFNSDDIITVKPNFFTKEELKDYIIVCYRPYELDMISTIEKL